MTSTERQGKILVIRGGAIGDFILTLPALAALRKQFPEAHLELLGYPHIAQLALAGGLVDRVQPIEARALAGFFARNGELSEDLRDYFSEFNIVVSYLFDPDEIFHGNLARCLHGQFLSGPHRPDESESVHATAVFLRPLQRLAIFDSDPVPRLEFPQPARTGGLGWGAGSTTLALHPGSGSERKNWPESEWSELTAELARTTRWNLLLVGGEAEGGRLERLAGPLPPERCRVLKNLPLPELARRLREVDAFVGHDSGITHLAAALGVPTVALWADSNEAIWRPLGDDVVVLKQRQGPHPLRVARVAEVLRNLVAG